MSSQDTNQTVETQFGINQFIPKIQNLDILNEYAKNIPEPLMFGLKILQNSFVMLMTNLSVVFQCIMTTCSTPQFYDNFSLSQITLTIAEKTKACNNPNVTITAVYVSLLFLINLLYGVFSAVFFDIFVIVLKWTFFGCLYFLVCNCWDLVMKKIKRD